MKKNSLAIYLKHKIDALDISVYELYTKMGGDGITKKGGLVSYSYLRNLINGSYKDPSPEILRNIAEALNSKYFELLLSVGYLNKSDIKEILESN